MVIRPLLKPQGREVQSPSGFCGAELVALIVAERTRQKLIARFGARKMWLHLRGKGHDVARCTIERLYREQGLARCVEDEDVPHDHRRSGC